MVVKIQVKVFWVVISCSNVVGHQHFGGDAASYLQGMTSPLRWRYPTTTLHGVTTPMTLT
jgi:hypothetical protein